MNNIAKYNQWQHFVLAALLICLLSVLGACRMHKTALTAAESAAISAICHVDTANFIDISREIMDKKRAAKFPAIAKVYQSGQLYAFIINPVAYNGPVTLALVIDGDLDESLGLQIVGHQETPHYVRDMEKNWFTRRFAHKSAGEYLKAVRLKATGEQDIVAITGATITTEGIVNGVNAAFGAYQEYIWGQNADDVPYMVRFEPNLASGPVETGYLAIRSYGLVLAEISLDEIRSLPAVKRSMSIHSSAGITQHAFKGTLLSNILNTLDPALIEDYSRALAVGVDDYISGIAMEEIMAENSVFIMYEDNGLPLAKKNGEPGALRIIVLHDVFGQRYTNYLLEIVLENEAP
ncbi:MAG: FMN-binding protein [Clostridiales bacterium]|nr:FMN-binding protein [Clostridiales bacterium]